LVKRRRNSGLIWTLTQINFFGLFGSEYLVFVDNHFFGFDFFREDI